MPRFRDPGVDLFCRKVAALSRLSPLSHLDLYFLRAHQIPAGHAEPPAGHLLDGGASVAVRPRGLKPLLTLTALSTLGEAGNKLLIPIVVLQTIAANLGSMLTPIGNPQNLYLFGVSDMKLEDFLVLMLPFTIVAGAMLFLWTLTVCKKSGKLSVKTDITAENFDTYSTKDIMESMGLKDKRHFVKNYI